MKNLTLATAIFALASAGAAQAADIPVKAPVLKAAPVSYNWTGCYVGVAGGGVVGRSAHISGDPGTFGFDIARYNTRGAIAGVEYGCNYFQSGMWVFGSESDFSWTNLKGSANNIAPFNTTSISGIKEHWLSTTRLRLGVLPAPNFMLYATGGLATARVEATVDATVSGSGILSESKTRWGWTAGGGAEYMIDRSWSAKVDYLYVRLNSKEYNNPPLPTFAVRANVPVDEHVFRFGINYKFSDCPFLIFGCSNAVVARY